MVVKPIEQLKKQIQELEEANEGLKSEIEQLKGEKKSLEFQSIEDKALIKKLQFAKKKNKDAESECHRLESELLSAKADMYTLRSGEMQELQDKLKSTTITLSTANKKCKIYENEISSLRRKLHDMIEELAKADTEKARLAYERQALEIDLETTIKKEQEKRRGTLENISPSFQEYIKIKRQLRETVEDNKKLEQEIESVSPRRKPEIKYLADS